MLVTAAAVTPDADGVHSRLERMTATTAASSAPNNSPGGLALPATSFSVVISPAAQIRAPRASSTGVLPRTSTGSTTAAAAKIPAAASTCPSISGVITSVIVVPADPFQWAGGSATGPSSRVRWASSSQAAIQ